MVSDFRQSGLSHQAYAEEIGIKLGTLRSMLYRRVRRAKSGFAAVQVTERAAVGGVVTLRWPQGMELDLPLALGETSLRLWVRELLGPCSR
jgi:hypothetical protein